MIKLANNKYGPMLLRLIKAYITKGTLKEQ